VHTIVLSQWGTGEGTCTLDNIMLVVIALCLSASQAPDLAGLPLKLHFPCTPHVWVHSLSLDSERNSHMNSALKGRRFLSEGGSKCFERLTLPILLYVWQITNLVSFSSKPYSYYL
jgi:hypothetical protein